jgi:hypothetical protein
MADREQPYDPYIPSGGAAPGGAAGNGGNQRTAALQAVRHPETPAVLAWVMSVDWRRWRSKICHLTLSSHGSRPVGSALWMMAPRNNWPVDKMVCASQDNGYGLLDFRNA